jgi:hypothetical protein
MVWTLFIQLFFLICDRVSYLLRSIRFKLLLQYGTMAFWLTKILHDWPISSQTGFANNSYLQVFLVLKLAYFIVSGLQIYCGYPPLESTGFQFLTRHPGPTMVVLYKIYRAIPFVFELRTMLDWMCNVSSLDL